MDARILALLVVVPTLMIVPAANADSGCAADGSALAIGPLYVGADATVWQETNNLAGLQRSACSDDNGRDHAADARVL